VHQTTGLPAAFSFQYFLASNRGISTNVYAGQAYSVISDFFEDYFLCLIASNTLSLH